eukprot:2830778-Amphidinium_carterae.1
MIEAAGRAMQAPVETEQQLEKARQDLAAMQARVVALETELTETQERAGAVMFKHDELERQLVDARVALDTFRDRKEASEEHA